MIQTEVLQKEYSQSMSLIFYYDYILNRIITKYGKNIALLDIGCGTGSFLDRAANFGIHHRVGIDPQRNVIQFNIKRNQHQHHYVEGYYTREKFAAESFDVIYHNHVLEHVENPVIFLKDNYYHLIAGGMLIVSVPSAKSPEFWFQLFSGNRLCCAGPLNPQHLIYFTPATLIRALKKNGFIKIHLQTGLWIYKRPKLRWLWSITIDPLFDFLKIGNILVFAKKSN